MITLFRFDEIEKGIKDKYEKAVQSTDEDERYNNVAEYLKYLEELYSGGSIGYVIFPNRVLSIAGIKNMGESHPEIITIIHLAADLDLPNHALSKGVDREKDTKKLIELIRSL